MVLQKILEFHGDTIYKGELPNFIIFHRQRDIYTTTNLHFKNLNAEYMLNLFTRRLFSSKEKFDKLFKALLESEPEKFEG